jgi:hypothetical protein
VPRRTRVPQAEARDAIGVNVFRRAFQFGKHGERVTRIHRLLVTDLE